MPLKVTKLGDLTGPICAMAEDVKDAEEILKVREDCHSRRSYVRALFAFVEGSVYFIKQTAFTAAIRSQIPLGLGYYALMREEAYNLDDKGVVKVQRDRYPSAVDNLRFAVNCVNEIFGSSISIDSSSRHWNDFKKAIKIRHRITHPKDLAEFEVSVDEIALCQRVSNDWLFGLVHDLVTAINDNITGRQHRRRGGSLSNDEIFYVAHTAAPSITRGRDCNLGEQGLDTCDPGDTRDLGSS